MSPQGSSAEALRRAFDERFAEPVAPHVADTERLLLADLGGARVALRLREIAGLAAAPTLVRLPGGSPGFVGLAGIRGRVLPVFSLAALLGVTAPPPARGSIVMVGDGERAGLLVAGVEGWIEVARGDLHTGDGGEVARVAGALVPIPSVPALLREIAARARAGGGGR